MYHPSVACGAHDDLFAAFLWIMTFVPGGPMGWASKLYTREKKCSKTDSKRAKTDHLLSKVLYRLPFSAHSLSVTINHCVISLRISYNMLVLK